MGVAHVSDVGERRGLAHSLCLSGLFPTDPPSLHIHRRDAAYRPTEPCCSETRMDKIGKRIGVAHDPDVAPRRG